MVVVVVGVGFGRTECFAQIIFLVGFFYLTWIVYQSSINNTFMIHSNVFNSNIMFHWIQTQISRHEIPFQALKIWKITQIQLGPNQIQQFKIWNI